MYRSSDIFRGFIALSIRRCTNTHEIQTVGSMSFEILSRIALKRIKRDRLLLRHQSPLDQIFKRKLARENSSAISRMNARVEEMFQQRKYNAMISKDAALSRRRLCEVESWRVFVALISLASEP